MDLEGRQIAHCFLFSFHTVYTLQQRVPGMLSFPVIGNGITILAFLFPFKHHRITLVFLAGYRTFVVYSYVLRPDINDDKRLLHFSHPAHPFPEAPVPTSSFVQGLSVLSF
jgi:hypothetical protein